MMRAVRNLLVVRAVGYDGELVDAAEADAARVAELAARFTEAELVRIFSLLAQLEQDIRHSADPRFQLEIGMVRLAELPRLRPLDEIVERLGRLEAQLAQGGGLPAARPTAPAPSAPASAAPSRVAAPMPATPARAPERMAPPSPPPEPPPMYDDVPPPFYDDAPPFEMPAGTPLRPARSSAPASPPPRAAARAPERPAAAPPDPPPPGGGLDGDEAVAAIKSRIEGQGKMLLFNALEASSTRLEGSKLSVRFDEESAKTHRVHVERGRAVLESVARDVTGRKIGLELSVGDGPAPEAPAPAKPAAKKAARPEVAAPPEDPAKSGADAGPATSDPIVQSVLETFRGQLLAFDPPPDEPKS
jgi:DNA polymerase-3 subunit gamma/tau